MTTINSTGFRHIETVVTSKDLKKCRNGLANLKSVLNSEREFFKTAGNAGHKKQYALNKLDELKTEISAQRKHIKSFIKDIKAGNAKEETKLCGLLNKTVKDKDFKKIDLKAEKLEKKIVALKEKINGFVYVGNPNATKVETDPEDRSFLGYTP